MQLYTNNIQSRNGDAIKGAQITVRTAAGALAILYADNGVTLATNPLIADASGEFRFYAANGRYTFTVSAQGLQAETVDAFELQDALELRASLIADSGVVVQAAQAAINNRYRGALAADPATRTDGSANVVGDEVFNSTANLLKRWNGATWQASDINTANLAAPSGAALVGHGSTTLSVSVGQSGAAVTRRSLTAPRPRMLPTAAFKKALALGVVRVTVVGDSISEASDIHYANCYVALLTEMLQEQIPTIDWIVSNVSIGGKSAENLSDTGFIGGDGSGNTFNRPAGLPRPEAAGLYSWTRDGLWTAGSSPGVTWRDHVKNLTPDFVVLAHGQNSLDEMSFATAMKAFIDYTKTWAKVPWLALVTTHLPSNTIAPWAAPDRQLLIQAIADKTRAIAVREGLGLIDANSAWRILRDGVQADYTHHTFEQNFRYWGDANKWTMLGASSVLTGNVLSSTATSVAVRKVIARDVDISAHFTLGNAGSYPKIVARAGATDLSGITVQMVGDNVQVYSRTTALETVPMGFIPASGATVRMRVKLTGSLIKIWVNDALLFKSSSLALLMTAGFYGVGWAGGFGNVLNYEANHTEAEVTAQSYYTQAQLLGGVPYGDPANLDSTGGNAINHPSNLGSHLAYIPAVAQFVREVQAKTDQWIDGQAMPYMPTFGVFGGAAFTMLTQTGLYTKNGAMVTVQGTVKLNAAATPGGPVVVSLPFAAAGNQTLAVGFASGISGAAGFTSFGITTIGGTTSALLRVLNPQTGTWGEVTSLTATAWLEFGGTYVAA